MWKIRVAALLILLAGIGVGYFVFSSERNPESRFPFKLGLDLAGGTHLVYGTDLSEVAPEDIDDSLAVLREVVERRVNSAELSGVFGVLDPLVQVERSSIVAGAEERRLVVELPGVTDVSEAVALIGETPLLEFKLLRDASELPAGLEEIEENDLYEPTGLTGRYLDRASLEFGTGHSGGISNEPIVVLDFNAEGGDLFADITSANVGRVLAIFLDGVPISTPVIQEEITGGTATISGNFDPEEARDLVKNLNFGALPVPIELASTQSIGASLGEETFSKGVRAGFIGIIAVAIFMVLWYRVPGIVAVFSLALYIAVVLAIFKLVPVTLTAAGIAGFIISIGMAVDANVLIFERMKEELSLSSHGAGKRTHDAIQDGFARAWLSIRDANISSIITAVILFWFGTSLVKGFALTFAIGVAVSMLSAITFTRIFLYALGNYENRPLTRFLFGSGVKL